MTTLTLMRRLSGFQNVPDHFVVPHPEARARAYPEQDGWRYETYMLPAGYSVGEANSGDWCVFGPDRLACEIVEHQCGRPQLVGRGSPMPVLHHA